MGFLKSFSIFSFILLLINGIITFKLNVPRILLPIFNEIESKFILEDVEGGCFKWLTTREDLIKLEPIDLNDELDCSTKVLITTVTKVHQKSKAVIVAEDIVNHDMSLKCDVIVDVIHHLAITTTTRELFIEDVPEIFQINAFDEQGNEFSTLEGVEFDWNIYLRTPNKTTNTGDGSIVIVRYLPFKDSPYEAPPGIDRLESENKKGSIILLQGLETGVVTVSVKLDYPDYQNIPVTEVQLVVMANLILLPHDVFVMPGDVIQLTTYLMQNNRMNKISLTEYKYYLKPEDNEIVQIDGEADVTALKVGFTKVILTNIDPDMENELIKLPYSNIFVVEPAYMLLNILPNKNWAILVGDHYDIIAELYTNSNERIRIGSSTQIQIDIDDSFYIREQTKNGSWINGWGLRENRVTVQANLESIEHPRLGKFPLNDNMIRATSELLIYPRISVIPSEVILPWDPVTKPKYHINITANGGDGRFLWSSTNTSLGVVTTSGQVHTLKDGSFGVFASMLRNHHNRQSSKFTILPPTRLEINEYIMEAAIDDPIYLHLVVYGEKFDKKANKKITLPFTLCHNLPFQTKLSNTNFYVNHTDKIPLVGMSCDNIAIIGKQVGTCKVTVTYQNEDLILEDSVIINTYNHLKLIQPENYIVLSVGSSMNIFYEGGPVPLTGRNTQHQRILRKIQHDDELDNDIIDVDDVTNNYELADDNSVIWVLCRKLGEIDMQLEIINVPTLTNCKTKPAILTTRIYCGKPRHVRLQPELQLIHTKKCPIDINSDKLIIPTNTNITLNVDIFDDRGRLFKNASTFILNWESSISNRIKFYNSNSVFTKKLMIKDKVPIANGSEQIISTTYEMGLVTIKTKVMSYDKKKLKRYSIKSEWPEFIDKNDKIASITPKIETGLNLLLMNNTTLNRVRVVIFNQPNVKRILPVFYGSTFLEFKLSSDDLAVIEYNQKNREIDIIPLKSGELILEINDLCIISEPIMLHITIITVDHIKVEMLEKVEINHCIECVVKLYDKEDNQIDIEESELITMNYRLSKPLIHLDLNPVQDNTTKNQINYVITGILVGYTDLVFVYEDKERDLSSEIIPVQVFEPLKVYPRNTTILVNTIQQLTIHGGPYPDANLEFEATNDNIEIDFEHGLVIGRKLGATDMLIKSVGISPYSGDKIVYCEDRIGVNIVKLIGIRVSSPLTKLRVSTMVPVWVTGIPQEISPIILGSFEEGRISFDWELQHNGVATISDILYPLGFICPNEDRVAIRLIGLNVGVTRLTLNVTILDELDQKIQFSAFHDFEVIDTFDLIQPYGVVENLILMAPNSQLQIKTNFDDTHYLTYTLPTENACDGSTELITHQTVFRNILDINDDGVLTSTGQIGFGLLIVTATDQKGWKRSVTYVVEVKPIHYMMLSVKARWRLNFNSNLNVIPVGTKFSLVPSFYDNLGKKFHTVPVNLEIRANRHDLLNLNYFKFNNTIKTKVKDSGVTVIKAWTSGESTTADYIRLRTQDVIKLVVDHMVSGDVLCLWSPIVSRELLLEKWTSSNPDALKIDNVNNIAIAIGDVESNVYLSNPLHPFVPIFLQILPVATVEFLTPPDLTITNGPIGADFHIPLVLKSEKSPSNKHTNVIQGWKCDFHFLQIELYIPYKCLIEFTNQSLEIEANDLFSVGSGIQLEVGQYYCELVVKDPNYVPYLATAITDLSLWVITDNQIESEHIILPFLPNVDFPNEIRFTADDKIAVLDIIGLEDILKQLEVEAADNSIIYVDSGTFITSNLIRYRVQVIDYHWKLANLEHIMGVRVKSPLTHQNSIVMVIVEEGAYSPPCKTSWLSRFLYKFRHSIVILLSVTSIFVLTCYVYSRYMRPVVNLETRRSLLQSNVRRNTCMSPAVPRLTSIQQQSPTVHVCTNRANCTCSNMTRSPQNNTSQGPVYGDHSFCLTSPELRRNRRFL